MSTPHYVKIKSSRQNVEGNNINTHSIATIQAYCLPRPVGRMVSRTKGYYGSHRHDEDAGKDLKTFMAPANYLLFLEASVPEVSLRQSR